MCGIAGIVGRGERRVLDDMLARLLHRGPDEEGVHEEPGVLLGIRRLRVIDPAGGRQPMAGQDGAVQVVFNGEIYNYRELRDELRAQGRRFHTDSDTEVLVRLYEQDGEKAFARLRGMFACAVWDRHRQVVLLVRDPVGIKPLYYASQAGAEGHQTVFASELPALLTALSSRSLSHRAIADYLSLLYVPEPETIYDGIRQVRPGELVRIDAEGAHPRPYQDLIDQGREVQRTSSPEARERFLCHLRASVQAHLVSDVPLGLLLSGGLDSGAILAMMSQVTDQPIRTFSVGYESGADQSYDELAAARILASTFATQHTEERVAPDVVKLLPDIVAAMGEPFADASAIPTYLICRVARRSVTVALSGIGGDELFGGYPRHLGLRAAGWYQRLPGRLRSLIARRVAPFLREGEGGRDHLGRLKRFLQDGDRSLWEQYLAWTTFVPREWGRAAFEPAFLAPAEPSTWEMAYRRVYETWPGEDPADRAMGLDLHTYLPADLLRMGDRLSMAHSLELRVPFCDLDLIRFARSVPAEVRLAGWRLKAMMRESLQALLPPAILARPKYGFRVPLARWLRQDLREMTRDVLTEDAVRRRGILKPAYVRWLLDEHEGRRRNCADQIYALLVLEVWLRRNEGH